MVAQKLSAKHYQVVIVGAGSSGVAAAIAAAKSGADVLLIESGPMPGGELLSGLPVDGCLNAQGEWIVGGVAKELFEGCEALDGYVGPVFDWRLNWGVCLDPEAIKLSVVENLARYRVTTLLYSFVEDVVVRGGQLQGVVVVNKNGRTLITADAFVDCSGDADVAVLAGAEFRKGSPTGNLQPLSLVFRMSNVDFTELLEFVRDHPEELILAESPVIHKSPAECALEVYKAGQPFVVLSAKGRLLGSAIETGEMFPTTAVYMWPTSLSRRELGLNTTRLAGLDGSNPEHLSKALSTLTEQVRTCLSFLRQCVPGFEDAHLSGSAPRVGIRETRRIVGDYELATEDVREGRKSKVGIAKGSHHIDLHGSGTDQTRIPVEEGRSYDIPYGCLVPKGLKNVLVAGRCISSSREANGSSRVMGPCMATGEAAGTAAAMFADRGWTDVREVPVPALREKLKSHGAIVDGTQ